MEKKSNSGHFSAPQLCAKCCSFYANPQFGTYCSKCYKELGINLQAPNPSKIEKEEVVPEIIVDEKPIINQTDHSLCWSCDKKAGMMAYKCKCDYTFCKKHRLPESHSCEFDFVKEGKFTLAKANPNLQSDKIERI